MKATARILTRTTQTSVRSIGNTSARAMGIMSDAHTGTAVLGCVSVAARIIRHPGAKTYLHVTPIEPQQLVWLVPQVGIDYYVKTSSQLEWIII